MLESAGLNGDWSLLVKEKFHASGETPRLRVKKSRQNGVLLAIKPGDNSTGVHAMLEVHPERPYTAGDLRLLLVESIKQPPMKYRPRQKAQETNTVIEETPVREPLSLDWDNQLTLMRAVLSVPPKDDIDAFMADLVFAVDGHHERVIEWMELAEHLCKTKYLVDKGKRYALSEHGMSVLELEKEEELTDELPTLVNRAGDELIKARPTINELLRRAHQLEECRAEQHKMLQEIMMLKRCLKELHRKELLITQGIDPDQLLSML
jgi:hypothetical protein